MNKVFIAYIWVLSLMGAIFLGNEIAMSRNDFDREIANTKINNCQKLIIGNFYKTE